MTWLPVMVATVPPLLRPRSMTNPPAGGKGGGLRRCSFLVVKKHPHQKPNPDVRIATAIDQSSLDWSSCPGLIALSDDGGGWRKKFHTGCLNFEEIVWFHPGWLPGPPASSSITPVFNGHRDETSSGTVDMLSIASPSSRHKSNTHTHTRTLATPTSSANRAAAAALRCSLTGFNVFSFFFLLLVEKEKSDTGTTGTGHPQGQHPRGSTPLGRGRWRSVATAPALAMHWRALQSRLHRGKSGDSVSSTADGPATLFSSRSEQGADVTFTPPPPPLPPVFPTLSRRLPAWRPLGHLTVDGTRPIRRRNGESIKKKQTCAPAAAWWVRSHTSPPPEPPSCTKYID